MKEYIDSKHKCPEDYICDNCKCSVAGVSYIQAFKERYVPIPDTRYDDRYILCLDCHMTIPRV